MNGRTEAVQVRRGGGRKRFKDKNQAGRSSLVESQEVLWVSARVHVCVYIVRVCVFVNYDRRIYPPSLL